jgi:8-oxo-dGTP pyrophosphatase MutT (NUDIX family)
MGYRVAYRLLQVYWFLARPHKDGVKCVLTDGDRVLLVRHTYGRRHWDLPGGSVKRHEPPVDTATREMGEELGVRIADWRPLGHVLASLDHRRDVLHCFQAELRAATLEVDEGEIAAARWFRRDALPPRVNPYVVTILERAGTG